MCYCHTTWINLTNIMSNKVSQPPTIYILYNSIYKKFENRKIGSWVGYLVGWGGETERKQRLEGWSSPGSWSFNSHMHTQVATQPDSGNPLLISRAFSVQLPPLWYSAPQTLATLVSQNPPLRPSGSVWVSPSCPEAWKQPLGRMLEQLKGSPHLFASFHGS